MPSKEKKLTVGDFGRIVADLKREGKITSKSEIWLSSDEEGNTFSPLMRFKDGCLNVGCEEDGSKFTLYPSSSHSEY